MKNSKNLFNPSGTIIEENGETHQVQKILFDGNTYFSSIPSRSLVLLLCKNEYESIFFYINSIERGIVPILIDADSDEFLLKNLIQDYQPEYIFIPSKKIIEFEKYSFKSNFKNYTLLKCSQLSCIKLHHELSLLLSTSGTTGSPKLVRLSYNNLISNAFSIAEYLNLDSTEISITNLPMNYSFGLSIINSHLFVGGSVLITVESITQRKFWDLFKKYKVTSLSGVPYTYEILKKFRLLSSDLISLKTLTQAGGKLSNDLIEYFANFSSKYNIKFFVMYGQTEGTARLSYLPPDFVLNKIGSIGIPIPNGEFYIIDSSGNNIDQPGISGELVYCGPNVMLGYAESKYDLTIGNENCFRLHTGDIAFFDNDKFYFIKGRINRFIKIFGNRINLDELEKLILSELGIQNACKGKDNELIIYILMKDDFTQLKNFLSKKIKIHFSAFEIRIIEVIPKSSSGKTLYSKLPD